MCIKCEPGVSEGDLRTRLLKDNKEIWNLTFLQFMLFLCLPCSVYKPNMIPNGTKQLARYHTTDILTLNSYVSWRRWVNDIHKQLSQWSSSRDRTFLKSCLPWSRSSQRGLDGFNNWWCDCYLAPKGLWYRHSPWILMSLTSSLTYLGSLLKAALWFGVSTSPLVAGVVVADTS